MFDYRCLELRSKTICDECGGMEGELGLCSSPEETAPHRLER